MARKRCDEGEHALAVVGVQELDQRALGERLGWVPKRLPDGRADVGDASLTLEDADDIGGVLDQRAEALFRAADGALFGERDHLRAKLLVAVHDARHAQQHEREHQPRGAHEHV